MAETNRSSSRKGTSTSSFGSSGRINHDSSKFYGSSLYADSPKEESIEFIENPVPENALNNVFCGTSQSMQELPENSIHLMITSPPYNVGKDYDDDLTLAEYMAFLNSVWEEVSRVLVPGGRACINIANLGRRPYLPIHASIAQSMIELGFLMRGEIIWHKGSSAGSSTAWGSWKSPSNPTLRDTHEYILVFSKGMYRRSKPPSKTATITRDEFLEFTKSVWEMPAVSAKRVGHPAPFPDELPYRLIQLYTYESDVVLDPFMGSGQTGIAALRSGRHYVGYDVDQGYVDLAKKRIRNYGLENLSPTLFDMSDAGAP